MSEDKSNNQNNTTKNGNSTKTSQKSLNENAGIASAFHKLQNTLQTTMNTLDKIPPKEDK